MKAWAGSSGRVVRVDSFFVSIGRRAESRDLQIGFQAVLITPNASGLIRTRLDRTTGTKLLVNKLLVKMAS
jgi:hypothetical protein